MKRTKTKLTVPYRNMMNLIRNICRILVGAVFIYSGFVKGIDPLGSYYKFIDYFNAFHMSWMNGSAMFFSFALALFEFLTGICLFLNIKTKTASWGAFLFMAVMTPLTLILAIKKPVSDCGCFGDALILSNWETFWKNMILLVLTLGIFFNRDKFRSIFNVLETSILIVLGIAFMLSIEFHCYKHLPFIDFRPYAIGKNITEGMTPPAGAPHDEYEITLQYRNKQTGELKNFTEENYPWQDTLNWEYANTFEKLVKEGYKTPIHDFSIEHPESGNITEDILTDNGYTLLAVSYDINKANPSNQQTLNELSAYAQEKGIRFYGLTASADNDILQYKNKHAVNYDFCTADETQLKTIIRSNPGLVLLHQGTVINKWSHRDLPDVEELQDKDLLAYSISCQQAEANRLLVYTFILTALACMGFYLARKYNKRH